MHKESLNVAFKKGINYFENRNYEMAKYYFNLAINNMNLRERSINYLMEIELKKGRYDKARKILEDNFLTNDHFNLCAGRLEFLECNLNESLELYNKSLKNDYYPEVSLMAISKLYINLGEYRKAIKLLNKLAYSKNRKLVNDALLLKINLFLILYDYNASLYVLNSIKYLELIPRQKEYYNRMKTIILYNLNLLDENNNLYQTYLRSILSSSNDDILLEHINRHKESTDKSFNCFYDSLNTQKLIEESRDKIGTLNGLYNNGAERFIVFHNKEIAESPEGKQTSAYCILTIPNTKQVITIYPIFPSYKYDNENLMDSNNLKLKRNVNKLKK